VALFVPSAFLPFPPSSFQLPLSARWSFRALRRRRVEPVATELNPTPSGCRSVRNRAKEIAELLSDVEKIRTERRKAKANRTKYTGVGNDGSSSSSSAGGFNGGFSGGPLSGASFQTQTGSRYGGFGSESLGGGGGGGAYPGDVYRSSTPSSARAGGGGGSSGFHDSRSTRPEGFEEYDAGDDEDSAPPPAASSAPSSSSRAKLSVAAKGKQQQQQQQQQQAPPKAVDLFDFGDEDVQISAAGPSPALLPSGSS